MTKRNLKDSSMPAVRSGIFRLMDAGSRIPGPAGEHSVSVLQRGTLNLKLSKPVTPNVQTPHTQDELYIIIAGRGTLCHDDQRTAFQTGDALFVAAGIQHHFENFSDDLAVWVVFYGREGGEQ